jgi:hypothetical protein
VRLWAQLWEPMLLTGSEKKPNKSRKLESGTDYYDSFIHRVSQNELHIAYVSDLLNQPHSAKSALAMRGRYVTAEAWKAVRVNLATKISGEEFAVLSDYYKNVLLLEEVAAIERAKKDRDADHETSSDLIYKAQILLQALAERERDAQGLIRARLPDVTASDRYAELAQKQENRGNPPP